MNRHPILMLLLLGVTGAGSACLMARESSFYQYFSMQDLATSNKTIAIFKCASPGGGGGNGGGISSMSGGVGGGIHSQSSKSDSLACRLLSDELPIADENRLLGSLQQQVEDLLRSNGADIKETGNPDSHSFYFSYSIQDIQGRIKVTDQSMGGYLYLQAELQENRYAN